MLFLGLRRHLSPKYLYTRYHHYISTLVAVVSLPIALFLWKFFSARALTPTDYGVLMFAYSISNMIGVVFSLGIPKYVVREAARGKDVLGSSLGASLVLNGAATLISIVLALTYGGDVGALLLVFLLPFIPSVVWKIYAQYLLGKQKFSEGAKLILLSNGALLLASPMIFLWPSPYTAALIWVTTRIMPFVLPSVIRSLKRITLKGAFSVIRGALNFFIITLSVGVFTNVDTIMLGLLTTYASVGLYRAASTLSRTVLMLAYAVAYVYLPVATSAAQNDKYRLKIATLKAVLFIALATTPILLVIALVPDQVLRILFGPAYMPIASTLVVLTMFKFLHALASVVQNGCIALGLEKKVTQAIGIGIVVNIILNALLIPPFGPLGAAFATGIAYLVTDGILAHVFIRRLKHNVPG